MSNTSRHSYKLARPGFAAPILDIYAIVPLAACVYALIVFHLLTFLNPPPPVAILSGTDARPGNRIVWPVLAIISVIFAVRNRHRLARLTWPPHVICLLACLALAGASITWAFRPEASFIRFVLEVMIVASIVLPAMLAAPTVDLMHGLFLCFAFSAILNLFFVFAGTATIVSNVGNYGGQVLEYLGSPGYFPFKNYLGECAAVGFLLSIYEILQRGRRRALGIIVLVIVISLIFSSDSKTALALALVAPTLAGLTLIARKITRLSPAIILLSVVFCYYVLAMVYHGDIMYRVAYMLYNDPTLTGRTFIWNFANYEIAHRPLLGWGYESFWLVPGSPRLEAPGWIRMMPNAHNGYYDMVLQLGYIGLAFLYVFIIATLHAIGRVAARDPARAWLILSLALFVILYNYLETLWFHGFEFLWVVFVFVAAETGRFWQPLPLTRAVYGSRNPRPGRPSPPPGAQTPRPGIRLS